MNTFGFRTIRALKYGSQDVCDTEHHIDTLWRCTDARHAYITSQDMTARCSMAAHLEVGKEYDLSTLVMNANGNCAKCKTPTTRTHLFATCPCGKPEVRLFGNVGEDPSVRFDYHNNPDGESCEYGGSKVATAHAHEEFFAHLAAAFNRLD